MSLRKTVAAPFKDRGCETLDRGTFVVSLSLDRDWFGPERATELLEHAIESGLLEDSEGTLSVSFDPGEVSVPADFSPDESVFEDPSPFEAIVEELLAAGIEKRSAVAGINELQRRSGISIEAAAVLYARREGLEVEGIADRAREELTR